ncbi:MAG: O-acetyl-ADP-ribose deacetylase [Planctomycetes bacterium]|nr:O-acetyl-ADP-ribose deacetylase [Planctomycetota bacterium]
MVVDPWNRILLAQGDITHLKVDAIVNAANERLAGGGGVDGAIHRAAGAEAMHAACAKLGGCRTGDAKITPGFELPAKFVIHTVGPVYADGRSGEPELLASCYRRSLELAVNHGLTTIAFPAISTGVYGYPFEAATEIALRTVAAFLSASTAVEQVIFIFFRNADFDRANAIHNAVRMGHDSPLKNVPQPPSAVVIREESDDRGGSERVFQRNGKPA